MDTSRKVPLLNLGIKSQKRLTNEQLALAKLAKVCRSSGHEDLALAAERCCDAMMWARGAWNTSPSDALDEMLKARQDARPAQVPVATDNTGHGHVRPRSDGVKARCGGPGICSECSAEAGREPGKVAP